jgi:hypothetical protein
MARRIVMARETLNDGASLGVSAHGIVVVSMGTTMAMRTMMARETLHDGPSLGVLVTLTQHGGP